MEGLEDIFPVLLSVEYNKKVTDEFYAKLVKKAGDAVIIDRALRVAAIEWNLCTQMNSLGFGFDVKQIERRVLLQSHASILEIALQPNDTFAPIRKDCKGYFESTDMSLKALT